MDVILGLAMLGGGGYALITGKIPNFLFGGTRYEVTGTSARVIGLVMMIPFPTLFVLPFLTGILFGREARIYAIILGYAVLFVVALGSIIAVRIVRHPITTVDDEGTVIEDPSVLESEIARKVKYSTIYLILSVFFGPAGLILCPLVILRNSQALRLIADRRVGQEYVKRAKVFRGLAIALLVLEVAFFSWIVVGFLSY